MTTHTYIDSPLGRLLLTSRENKLSGLYFADGALAWPASASTRNDNVGIFIETARQLEEYAAGKRTAFELPLALAGTPFQVQVWNAIAAIPFGQTISYGDLALQIGQSVGAARAIGAAAGRNPVGVVVPCHRVIGRGGDLTGYAGGLLRKQALLEFETALAAGRDVVLRLDMISPALAA